MNIRKVIGRLLCVYFFVLPWQTVFVYQERFLNGSLWQYGTLKFFLSELLFWLIVVLQVGVLLKQAREQKVLQRFSWSKDRQYFAWVFVFLLYCYVSRFWAVDPLSASQYSLYMFEHVLLFVFVLFLYRDWIEMFVKSFVVGGILPVVFGVYQFFVQFGFSSAFLGLAEHDPMVAGTSIVASEFIGRVLRAYGSFGHPNVFGGYVVMLLAGVGYWYHGVRRTFERCVLVVLGGLFAAGLVVSFSRSAWIAAVVLGVGYMFHVGLKSFVRNWMVFVVVGVSVVVGFVQWDVVSVRLGGGSFHEQVSVSERVSGISVAQELFVRHLFLGVGPGGFTAAMYELYPDLPGWEYQPVHVGPLLFIVEYGIVGLLLFTMVLKKFIQFFCVCISRKRRVSVGMFLLVPLVLSLFDHYLLSQYVGLMMVGVWYAGLLALLSTFYPVCVHRS